MSDIFTDSGAVMSADYKFRYELWRIWDATRPKVLLIGLNPSKADANFDDHTIKRVRGFVEYWGYGGFYMGNLWSIRATDPFEMELVRDAWPRQQEYICNAENDMHLLNMADLCEKIVFCWGTSYTKPDRLVKVKSMFPLAWCIEVAKNGEPKHPLYLKKNLPLRPYGQF